MNSFNQILQMHCEHLENDGTERFGQFFCNRFIKNSWPTLFYSNYETASELIYNWLNDHQYTDNIPKQINHLD